VAKRVSFSNEHQNLNDISLHHSDTINSLRTYFSNARIYADRFSTYTIDEIQKELGERLHELNLTSSLSLLAALEAVFRIDYLQRNYKRKKDALSAACRDIYKEKEIKASLEDDILNAWRSNTEGANQLISDLKGAFKYRHWLAHGRYWKPKMGRPSYDYETIYELAGVVLNSFPFEGLNA
jgi:hypothetical protein